MSYPATALTATAHGAAAGHQQKMRGQLPAAVAPTEDATTAGGGQRLAAPGSAARAPACNELFVVSESKGCGEATNEEGAVACLGLLHPELTGSSMQCDALGGFRGVLRAESMRRGPAGQNSTLQNGVGAHVGLCGSSIGDRSHIGSHPCLYTRWCWPFNASSFQLSLLCLCRHCQRAQRDLHQCYSVAKPAQ
jgi:hypothetical protein